jgi:hypothetical protein
MAEKNKMISSVTSNAQGIGAIKSKNISGNGGYITIVSSIESY